MSNRKMVLASGLLIAAMILGLVGWTGSRASPALGASPGRSEPAAPEAVVVGAEPAEALEVAQQDAAATDPLILSYAVKFICQEPIQPGHWYYGSVAPLVRVETDILVHNPHDFPVTFYKKAVIAPLEDRPPVNPGAWRSYGLKPDHAFRINCDDIAGLLTGNPQATFLGTYGIGVTVEGFVVVGIGPQTVAGTVPKRYAPLDVTAEYARGSEVLKKDVNYQPWWWWWWWPLPWRLGYAYQRLLPIQEPAQNIDCRSLLYTALERDTATISDTTQANLTRQALAAGKGMDPTNVSKISAESPPALVALIGRCDKIDATMMSVDYVLMSNKGPTDPNPQTGTPTQASQVFYPWLPGRWYDLPVVMPQNVSTDMHDYFIQWHSQRWIDAGESEATVTAAMAYYIPYWCGWGYWWSWWNAGDCTDIGVGDGESLDVEVINPTRVFMTKWPPIP